MMRKGYLLLLSLVAVIIFTSANAMAYDYIEAEIPEFSVYFAAPGDTEHSITGINNILPGETFDFDVRISDVSTEHGGMKNWAFDTQNDPLVSFDSWEALGGFLGANPDPIYGLVDLPEGWDAQGHAAFTFAPSLNGNVPLMKLTFKCEGPGSTNILPTWHWGNDDDFVMSDDWTFGNPTSGEPGYQGIVVSQVPIPGTVLLLGSGLLGLFGIRRRRTLEM